MEINISEIKRIVNLIKKIDCREYALITDVAKEMSIKKTSLMQFIEDNPKLFQTKEIIKKSKNKEVSLGLAITKVYLAAKENPETGEWLEMMQEKWKNKIHIGEQTYYGRHEYYYIPLDWGKGKYEEYRNTEEKIKFLEDNGVIEKVKGGYGGFGDYYSTTYYAFNKEVKEKLEKIGWTSDFEEDDI